MRLRTICIMVAAALLLVACASAPAQPEPAKIRFGETMCAECGMIISEVKFASSFAYQESPGRYTSLAFDDIGDMLAYMRSHAEIVPDGAWVHDYESEEWIDATTAFYVTSEQIRSPMGHGVAAFASSDAAATFAATIDATVSDWDALRIEHAMMNHQH